MVAGHLTKRNGYYYAVLSYYDPDGKRHFKTFSTGLKVVSVLMQSDNFSSSFVFRM